MDELGIDSDPLYPAKADNSAVFVGPDCSLLSSDEDYKIAIILKSWIGID